MATEILNNRGEVGTMKILTVEAEIAEQRTELLVQRSKQKEGV